MDHGFVLLLLRGLGAAQRLREKQHVAGTSAKMFGLLHQRLEVTLTAHAGRALPVGTDVIAPDKVALCVAAIEAIEMAENVCHTFGLQTPQRALYAQITKGMVDDLAAAMQVPVAPVALPPSSSASAPAPVAAASSNALGLL